MPARPVESRPGSVAVVYARVPAELHNQVVEAAALEGVTVNAWVTLALRSAVRHGLGLPDPVPVAPLPDPVAAVTAWAAGERLLGPCGRSWPCDASAGGDTVGGVTWCRCGIRLA